MEYVTQESFHQELEAAAEEHVTKAMATAKESMRQQVHQQPPQDNRELQVIVGGLKEEEEEDCIIKQIEHIVEQRGVKDRIVKVSTFPDPAKIGVLDFATGAAKRGFPKKTRGNRTGGSAGKIC
eukprot:770129-Pyramimonas_sp.AAC.1